MKPLTSNEVVSLLIAVATSNRFFTEEQEVPTMIQGIADDGSLLWESDDNGNATDVPYLVQATDENGILQTHLEMVTVDRFEVEADRIRNGRAAKQVESQREKLLKKLAALG